MNKTPLHKAHIQLGAKMVNFSNWEMPISYSSLIEEHNACLLYTSPSPRDRTRSRMPSSA